jgi:hypothetical protein
MYRTVSVPVCQVRKELLRAVGKNKERAKTASAYSEMLAEAAESSARANPMDSIIGIPSPFNSFWIFYLYRLIRHLWSNVVYYRY